jgi:hypothetical protein
MYTLRAPWHDITAQYIRVNLRQTNDISPGYFSAGFVVVTSLQPSLDRRIFVQMNTFGLSQQPTQLLSQLRLLLLIRDQSCYGASRVSPWTTWTMDGLLVDSLCLGGNVNSQTHLLRFFFFKSEKLIYSSES